VKSAGATVADDVEGLDALMLSEDCGDLCYGIGLVVEDVGGGVGFDARGYVVAVWYCGVEDDEVFGLVAGEGQVLVGGGLSLSESWHWFVVDGLVFEWLRLCGIIWCCCIPALWQMIPQACM
jgi:hypothetical protein